jgi:hypothetical protein
LVVRVRAFQEAAALRWFAQGHELHADRVQGRKIGEGLVLRLQAHVSPSLQFPWPKIMASPVNGNAVAVLITVIIIPSFR